MKTREVVFYKGEGIHDDVESFTFTVPERIQRIDTRNTHGWQVRWGGTQLFSDGVCGGPEPAFKEACKDLSKRLLSNPPNSAQSFLDRTPQKKSKVDGIIKHVGVYGPLFKERLVTRVDRITPTRKTEWFYAVYIPVIDATSKSKNFRTSVYIGTNTTYNDKKAEASLEKALLVRKVGVEKFCKARKVLDKQELSETLILLKSFIGDGK